MTLPAATVFKHDELGTDEIEMRLLPSQENEPEPVDVPDAPLIDQSQRQEVNVSQNHVQSSANLFVWTLTLSSCVSGLLFGYDTGVISSTLVSIGTDLSSRPLTNLDKGLITSCTSLFALIASPIAGVWADKIGRKKIILLADALFTAGALWQALTNSVWGMILGRGLIGLAIGAASLIVPLYITELAPSHLRGRLITVSLLFLTGGQVVAYIIGWLFSSMPGGWRWMVGIGAIPALGQLTMLFFMPETPRFLMKAEREDSARRTLARVYRSTANASSLSIQVEHIINAIKKEFLKEEQAKLSLKGSGSRSLFIPPTLASLVLHPPHARALGIACMLQGFQQLCGFNSLMYFSATIFSLLQFSSPTLTSLSIAGMNFAFTLVAFYLIDLIGRRRILLLTVPFMAVALLLCALAFAFVELPPQSTTSTNGSKNTPNSRVPAIAILVSLLLYVASFATGIGPVPWQQSELFPLPLRSVGSSISTATNWGCNTVVGLTFLPMMEVLTPTWTFVVYAAVCVLGWMAVWLIYPETAALDLEEVGDLLKDGWGVEESVKKAYERKTATVIKSQNVS